MQDMWVLWHLHCFLSSVVPTTRFQTLHHNSSDPMPGQIRLPQSAANTVPHFILCKMLPYLVIFGWKCVFVLANFKTCIFSALFLCSAINTPLSSHLAVGDVQHHEQCNNCMTQQTKNGFNNFLKLISRSKTS